jgi:hypothetical protein
MDLTAGCTGPIIDPRPALGAAQALSARSPLATLPRFLGFRQSASQDRNYAKESDMTSTSKFTAGTLFCATLIIFVAWYSAFVTAVEAQTGYNAIFSGGVVVPSSSFIDATAFPGSDICARLFNAISYSGYPTAGRVVDGRGLNSGNTSMTCLRGSTPWSQTSGNTTNPATILLPAGNIVINSVWVIPSQTSVIGEGRGRTTVTAASNFLDADMIDFCASSCFGVGLAGMIIDGGGQNINGVVNNFAQEQTYVNEVSIHGLEVTGLSIGSGASNSGPYSNLSITAGGSGTCPPTNPSTTGCPTALTACVKIINVSTRGIHGITCTANGVPNAAIYLDGSNNTIEDLHFEGFVDGILVGDQSPAAANVLLNVNGASGGTTSGVIQNVIHISNATTSGVANARDLSIIGVANYTTFNKTTIQDDLTSTTLNNNSGDSSVGVYFLGRPMGGGYSRLTTSPTVPAWGVGRTAPTGSCATGSVFSNTSGTPNSFYVCQGGSWVGK